MMLILLQLIFSLFSGLVAVTHYEFQIERDEFIRKCNIYLLFLPMDDYHGKGKHLPKIRKFFNGEDMMIKHWSLIFEFDHRVIKVHAGMFQLIQSNYENDANLLFIGTGLQGSLMHPIFEDLEWNQRANATFLTALQTSPKMIQDLAMANELTLTRYDTVHNNCQEWVLELLRMMIPELPTLTKYINAALRSKYNELMQNIKYEL